MSRIERIRKKIMSTEELKRLLAYSKLKELKVVFTNGCFDMLHLGHIEYLSGASDLGDVLVVGVNSDESVRRLKGPGRPLNNQEARSTLVASLIMIDAVFIFDEDTPYELIKLVQPDILVKGGDYQAEDVVGYDIVKAKGGEVVILPFVEGYSTTNLIEKYSGKKG